MPHNVPTKCRNINWTSLILNKPSDFSMRDKNKTPFKQGLWLRGPGPLVSLHLCPVVLLSNPSYSFLLPSEMHCQWNRMELAHSSECVGSTTSLLDTGTVLRETFIPLPGIHNMHVWSRVSSDQIQEGVGVSFWFRCFSNFSCKQLCQTMLCTCHIMLFLLLHINCSTNPLNLRFIYHGQLINH